MRVLKDRVLIERCKKEEAKTKSGILLLDEKPLNLFTVVDIGPDVSGVFEGKIVQVEPYSPIEIQNDEKRELYVVYEKQIVVVL